MCNLPANYAVLSEGLWGVSLYSSVTVLVNESGYQYGVCLNVACDYFMTEHACEECRRSHFGVLCILSDSPLHFLAELRGLTVC